MLNNLKRVVILLMILPVMACAQDKAPYKEGEHYFKLDKEVATTSGDKIEVLELFWYGCPHCYALEPRLNKWLETAPDDIAFQRMPAVMGRGWDVHGKAYYAVEQLGALERTHEALFAALHRTGAKLYDQASLAGFYAQQGVDAQEFNKAYASFSVNSKLQKARLQQQAYRARGVPAIIVNGKYRVGSQKDMLKVVDYLVDNERSL